MASSAVKFASVYFCASHGRLLSCIAIASFTLSRSIFFHGEAEVRIRRSLPLSNGPGVFSIPLAAAAAAAEKRLFLRSGIAESEEEESEPGPPNRQPTFQG